MEKQDAANPYDALQRIFHEPHRLAIMSSLCALTQGESFTELKRDCGLTDGNLSRHLRAMEAAGVITITKTFVGRRPRTTIIVTDEGRETFLDYLGALEAVLNRAVESVQPAEDVAIASVLAVQA